MFKPEGFTQADLVTCKKCGGLGFTPPKQPPKKRYDKRYRPVHKNDGMELLKDLETE